MSIRLPDMVAGVEECILKYCSRTSTGRGYSLRELRQGTLCEQMSR